jgi:hypothetical protein
MKKIDYEDELDAIRVALYEEIKDMSPSEVTAYFNAKVKPVEREFNIRVLTETEVGELRQVSV